MLLLNQLLMFDHGHDFRRLLKFNARKSLAQLSMRLVELLGCYQQIKHWLIGSPAHYDRYDISRLRHEYVRHTDGGELKRLSPPEISAMILGKLKSGC